MPSKNYGQRAKLIEVFVAKNKKINLSAIRSAEDVYIKHVLDSLELIKFFNLQKILATNSYPPPMTRNEECLGEGLGVRELLDL